MKNKKTAIIVIIIVLALVHIRINASYGFRLPGLTFELWKGTCVSDNYDGIAHLMFDTEAYVSYYDTDAQKGDEMVSVFFYNPFNLYYDDILIRFDYNPRTGNHFWWMSEL